MNKQWERAKIRIATVLSAVSIAICAISIILLPLSFVSGVQLSLRNGAGVRYALLTVPGRIGLSIVHGEPRALVSLDGCTKSFGSDADPLPNTQDKLRWFWRVPASGKVGFTSDKGTGTVYFGEVNDSFKCDYASHFVPTWLLSIITFIGPILWYRARRLRQHRVEHDLCTYCGADMSASPYRCPKCGKERPWD